MGDLMKALGTSNPAESKDVSITGPDIAENGAVVPVGAATTLAGAKRLLLLTDPKPLPVIGDTDGSWEYYLRNWRPGKPHRHTWDDLYGKAFALMEAEV